MTDINVFFSSAAFDPRLSRFNSLSLFLLLNLFAFRLRTAHYIIDTLDFHSIVGITLNICNNVALCCSQYWMQNNRIINFKETQQMYRNALAVVLYPMSMSLNGGILRSSMQTDSINRQQSIESLLHFWKTDLWYFHWHIK